MPAVAVPGKAVNQQGDQYTDWQQEDNLLDHQWKTPSPSMALTRLRGFNPTKKKATVANRDGGRIRPGRWYLRVGS